MASQNTLATFHLLSDLVLSLTSFANVPLGDQIAEVVPKNAQSRLVLKLLFLAHLRSRLVPRARHPVTTSRKDFGKLQIRPPNHYRA